MSTQGVWIMVTESRWTIAYRRPTANRFARVDLDLSWSQAFFAAYALGMVRPDLEIYYTTTRDYEGWQATEIAAGRLPAEYADDHGNILVYGRTGSKGKRVRMTETGQLDPRVCILPADLAERIWHRRAI